MRKLRGNVPLHGNNYDEAQGGDALVETEGRTLIHPFDDPMVIAGQGTIGAKSIDTTGKPSTRSSYAAAAGCSPASRRTSSACGQK